jgi:hypothetical protein
VHGTGARSLGSLGVIRFGLYDEASIGIDYRGRHVCAILWAINVHFDKEQALMDSRFHAR